MEQDSVKASQSTASQPRAALPAAARDAAAASGTLAARVRPHVAALNEAERRVADTLLNEGAALVGLSVSDVAALAGTSASTVVRTCQRLGFRGYQEVKISAARETPQRPPDLGADPAARALAETVRAGREALEAIAATLPPALLRDAADALAGATRVLVVGAGLSGPVAADAAYRLRATGCAVDAPADPLTGQLAAGLLSRGTVCLAISHTGATRTTVDAARRAREAGATVVAVTSYAHSPLTETSDRVLLAGGQDLVLGLEAVASRLAHLAVIDALTLLLRTLRGDAAERGLALSAEVTADHAF